MTLQLTELGLYVFFLNVEPEGYVQIQYFILQLNSDELFKFKNVKYLMMSLTQ